MAKARYRIEQITIEGFRGFTEPQVVRCKGKHLFVFGFNGRGKSSIVEAVRWCLFGSKPGREIEVRNTFYEKGECAVTLQLIGTRGQLQLKRELRPGSNRSTRSLFNGAGEEVSMDEVLPQLARIGDEQGTQVIFAAQHAVGRQAQVDITDFSNVLCFYLHLEDVPKIITGLQRLLEERTDQAGKLAERLEVAEHGLRGSIHDLHTKMTALISNPPWGDGTTPTGRQTETKITAVLKEHARLRDCRPPKLAGKVALDQVHQWIEESKAASVDSLQTRRGKVADQLDRAREELEELRKSIARTGSLRAEHVDAVARREELVADRTIKDIRSAIDSIEQSLSNREKRAVILRQGEALCRDPSLRTCPLCGAPVDPESLHAFVVQQFDQNDCNDDTSALSGLRATLGEIERIDQLVGEQARLLAQAQPMEDEARAALSKTLRMRMPVTDADVERRMDKIEQSIESLDREINSAVDERQRRTSVVRKLEAELEYHECRDALTAVQRSLEFGLQPARDVLVAYHDLLDSSHKVSQLIDNAFNEALDRSAPPLEKMLTEVFSRLTGQVSYDRIRIWRNPESPGRRELRVASSRLDDRTFPPNVLNGQAAKALQLVPYFVFSRFKPENMDLELLLIDDPSQSFDTSHVGSLVKELAGVASHAQLVVATHEREKFEPHVKTRFSREPYLTAAVEDFHPVKGPTVVQG